VPCQEDASVTHLGDPAEDFSVPFHLIVWHQLQPDPKLKVAWTSLTLTNPRPKHIAQNGTLISALLTFPASALTWIHHCHHYRKFCVSF
jgi:hypothetical protein